MTPSIQQAQVSGVLRAFLLSILPAGVEVIIAQENRVPEPTSDNFVLLTLLDRSRLGTNTTAWDQSMGGNPTTITDAEAVSIGMQLDFHGADSTDNAQVFAVLFRSAYACDYMAATGVSPDYCTDGQQMPFINGENAWEDRWVLNAVMDCVIAVEAPQQFANTLQITLIDVDAVYPPSGA